MAADNQPDTMEDMRKENRPESDAVRRLRAMASFPNTQVRRRAFSALLRLLLSEEGGR